VGGTGNYNCGSSVTLTATANACYTFANWTENDTVVSTSANYNFTASSNRTRVANFTLGGCVIPTVSVSVSPRRTNEGNSATFTIFASPTNHARATVVYSMSDKAIQGTDYTLSGTPRRVTIPAGQPSATVNLAFEGG
jgi:hypothetical protein